MKIFHSLFITLFLISISVVTSVNASTQEVSKVEIKCHAELVGGVDIIHFALVRQSQLAGIKRHLTGQKISTALSKNKQVIYKVNECVGLHESFVSASAKSRDILTAR